MEKFINRMDAGRVLAGRLSEYTDIPNGLVLALPRGGVPVAYEVSQALHLPLDIFIVRKLGVPGQEELAMGAIATGGVRVLNHEVIRHLGIPQGLVDQVTEIEHQELERRELAYRGNRPPPDVRGKTVILVDDGLATGASMFAAVLALQQQQPDRIVVAVPTAAPETCQEFERIVYQVVCTITPEPFHGVGAWYEDFSQTTDEQVRDLLKRSQEECHL